MGNKERDDKVIFEGVVLETNKGIFKVQVADNHIVVCRLSGKIKLADVKVIVGDKVIVETSVYDLSLGRITRRMLKDRSM